MAGTRGKGTNSAEVVQSLAANRVTKIPAYVDIKPEAREFWPQFTAARAPKDWGPYDLILLAKICNIEARIRLNESVIDEEGYVLETKRGAPIANPLVQICGELQRRQLSILRMLSLGAPTSNPHARAGASKKTKEITDVFDADDDGLLAEPGADE